MRVCLLCVCESGCGFSLPYLQLLKCTLILPTQLAGLIAPITPVMDKLGPKSCPESHVPTPPLGPCCLWLWFV